MTGGNRSGARWIIAVLTVALVASGLVVYALVRITSPSGGSEPGTAAQTVETTDTAAAGTPGPTAGSTSHPATGTPSAPPSGTGPPPSSASPVSSAPPPVPPTTTLDLPGSGITLPAAWSGTAKVSVTVLGSCATSTPSVYADLQADLAVDLIQNEANAAEVPLPEGVAPSTTALTLGVNPNGVPSIALYSSQLDEDGTVARYWDVTMTPDGDRTQITGRLAAQPTDGSTPNMMVDAETSLQPCESAGTVSLPRALADGATLTGWITASRASLTLHGTTTDGKRSVTAVVDAARSR